MKKFFKQLTVIEYAIMGVLVLLVIIFTTSSVSLVNSLEVDDTNIMESIGEGVRTLKNDFDKGYDK